MTSPRASAAQEWIEHDPDPATAAELKSCSDDELAERFALPLTFGTAGLRGPMRGGPGGMNLAVVLRTSWAVAQVLKERGFDGSNVVVGGDARHGSEQFALAAAEVFAAQGFMVTLLFAAVPTPVVAFGSRHLGASAGIQITASHNPPSDNGYKVYFDSGIQIVPPTDREVEALIAKAPHADEIPRAPVQTSGMDLIQRYVNRASQVRHTHGSVRLAFTPMHGVGGEYALDAFVKAGLSDVAVVESQFAPDPDFPTVPFPNPEEPGATDELLKLAADNEADVAIALDPDADRCAVGVPTPDGWRMLTGDETGWLLGDYILSQIDPGDVTECTVVASSVVSSRMLSRIAAAHGARHVETLTGFTWACLCLRGGNRLLRRPVSGPRQRRHQHGGAVLRPRRSAARAGTNSPRRTRRPCPTPRRAHHDGGVPAGGQCRRRRGGDDPAAFQGADETVRVRRDDDGSGGGAALPTASRRGDPHRRRHRYRSADRGPAVGYRAEGQVLHRSSTGVRRR
jgi:phosphomannomutase